MIGSTLQTIPHRGILAAILVLALFLRLTGLRFGEPLAVHPEEHKLVFHSMQASAQGGNPGWFEYPSGMIYLTLLLQGVRYFISGHSSAQEYWREFQTGPFPYHLWVRFFVAVVGTIGVLAVWLLGREWDRGRKSMRFLGLGSAGLLSVHFLHLRDSHFATVDIPLTTAVTFALWLILREFHRKRTTIKRLLGVALFVGICCGIKYTAAPLVFPLLYVGLLNVLKGERTDIGFPWLVGSAAVLLLFVALGFFLTTPYAVLDAVRFWSEIGYGWFASGAQPDLHGGGQPFLLGYLQGPWMWGGGSALGTLAFFGFMMAVLRREPEDRVLLAFAVPYWLMISFLPGVWGRWFLPLVPLQVLWSVRFVAVYADHPWAKGLMTVKTRRVIAAALLVLVALPSLLPGLRLLVLLARTDSRVLAAEEIEKHLQGDDFVLVTPFCPPLPKEIPRKHEDGLLQELPAYDAGDARTLGIKSLAELVDEGINKVLFSSFYWDSIDQDFAAESFPGISAYRSFRSDLYFSGRVVLDIEPIAGKVDFHPEDIYAPTFHVWAWRMPGPRLRLFELPLSISEGGGASGG